VATAKGKGKPPPKLSPIAEKIKAEMDGRQAVMARQFRVEEANAKKLLAIYHILAIYTEQGHERQCEIPLEKYSLGELETHLRNLREGKFPW
jgi:hypothetical protein